VKEDEDPYVISFLIWLLVFIMLRFVFYMESETAQSVLGCRLNGHGSAPTKDKIFLLSTTSRLALRFHLLPIELILEFLSPGVY
jgi:hypothetical protein